MRRKKKQKKLIVCAIVIVIIMVAGILYLIFGDDSQPIQGQSTAETQISSDAVTNETEEEETVPEESVTSESQEAESEKAASEIPENATGDDGSVSSGITAKPNVVIKNDTETQEDSETVNLPYRIQGSDLVIQKFDSYSGGYIEDGSDENVSDITVAELVNEGKTNIEYVRFSVRRGDEKLEFEASAIPAGATVVVQEKNRAAWKKESYTKCEADVAEIETFEMSGNKIKVEETGDQTLKVTNLTNDKIPAVRIFYKFYMEDEKVYVGGITYNAKVTDLEGGSSVEITPSHYTKGMSKIMMVRTYTTNE